MNDIHTYDFNINQFIMKICFVINLMVFTFDIINIDTFLTIIS
jgi:hypothetical protein